MATETSQSPGLWTPKQIAQATLFIVFVTTGFYLLYRFRAIVLILFVAMLIGTGVKPAVSWLARKGLPRVYGEILIYACLAALIIAFLLLVLPLVLEQGTLLLQTLSEYYNRIRILLVSSPSELLRDLGIRLSPLIDVENLMQNQAPGGSPPAQPAEEAAQAAADSVASLFNFIRIFSRSLFALVAVVLVAFYWTLEGDRAVRSILLIIPSAYREEVRSLYEAVEGKLGGFLIGQSILCLVVGILSLIAYLLIGLPNALVLGIIAGVLEAVPTLGPVLGIIPAVLVAIAADPSKVIWVLVAGVIIQLLENNLLVPRIMDRSVGVHPLLTLLSLATLSSLLGLTGALLAVPLAAIFQLMINRMVFEPIRDEQPQPEGRDYLSLLRMRAQELAQDSRKLINQRPVDGDDHGEAELEPDQETIEESIEALANDLNKILSQIASPEEAQP